MKRYKYVSMLAVVCIVQACFAQGTLLIDFNGPPVQAPNTGAIVANYDESGMLFTTVPTSVGLVRMGMASGSEYPRSLFPDDGSAYIQMGLAPAAPVEFSFTNGSLFGAVSVDLAEYSTVLSNATTVTFIGYHPDGSTVTENFTTDGVIDGTGPLADFQTFDFTGFTDLTRMEIPSYGWSLDNLVISVPEPPAGMLLLIGGLIHCAVQLQNFNLKRRLLH